MCSHDAYFFAFLVCSCCLCAVHTPSTRTVAPWTARDRCLIIASDGVWDFVEPKEAVQIVRAFFPNALAACKALVETASQYWVEDDPTYRDDISAIVIFTPLDPKLVSARFITRQPLLESTSISRERPVQLCQPRAVCVCVHVADRRGVIMG
jgi:hypothetical protein